MTFKDIQKQVHDWIKLHKIEYFPPMEIMGNLQEEAGELAGEVNRKFGSKPRKDGETPGDLGEEIADVIFTMVCLANSQGIDLEESWQNMIQNRLYGRDKDRYERKEEYPK